MGFHVLVVGSGGREHAIAHQFIKSSSVTRVSVAPGNLGMTADGIDLVNIEANDIDSLIDFAKREHVDFAFIGPEVPLMQGIVDEFAKHDLLAFGPCAGAAQLEGSKDFAKRFMDRHHIPTATYRTFSELDPAVAYVKAHGAPIVIKADGLAAGKGVTVAQDIPTALQALHQLFVDHRFGDAGAKVVIEDFLEGQEFSLMSFVNGEDYWVMPIAQDHKRAYDNDLGPNTGGMGAYSPVPQINQAIVDQAIAQIVEPTVRAMKEEGNPFTGVLYAGLIVTESGPKVIEFNVRFGDPETQVVLPRLTADFGQIIWDILHHQTPHITWKEDGVTLGVVVASEGYPSALLTGFPIPHISLEHPESDHVYYAGVARNQHEDASEQDLVSDSGRVLLLQVHGTNIKEAQQRAYKILDHYHFEHMFYRHDIGSKALD